MRRPRGRVGCVGRAGGGGLELGDEEGKVEVKGQLIDHLDSLERRVLGDGDDGEVVFGFGFELGGEGGFTVHHDHVSDADFSVGISASLDVEDLVFIDGEGVAIGDFVGMINRGFSHEAQLEFKLAPFLGCGRGFSWRGRVDDHGFG